MVPLHPKLPVWSLSIPTPPTMSGFLNFDYKVLLGPHRECGEEEFHPIFISSLFLAGEQWPDGFPFKTFLFSNVELIWMSEERRINIKYYDNEQVRARYVTT